MSLNELRFSNLVRDLEPDHEAYEREFSRAAPADKKFVIFFTARSGSTWLTSLLSGTGLLGRPEEYFNPNFIGNIAKSLNCKEPEAFLNMLIRRRKTPNGVFGVEVRAVDVKLFDTDLFFKTFGADTVFFNLWRANLVAQGLSLYRAVTTKRYHSSDNVEKSEPPSYDGAGIRRWIDHVANTENDNIKLLQAKGIRFTNICYEEMVQDRLATIQKFASAVSVDIRDDEAKKGQKNELKKIGDNWNRAAEALFREENQSYLEGLDNKRLITPLAPMPLDMHAVEA